MVEVLQNTKGSVKEFEKTKTQTDTQMHKARLIDYIAIILGVGTVLILWLLQWAGLY